MSTFLEMNIFGLKEVRAVISYHTCNSWIWGLHFEVAIKYYHFNEETVHSLSLQTLRCLNKLGHLGWGWG